LLARDVDDDFDPWIYYSLASWLQCRPLNGQQGETAHSAWE